MRSSLARVVVVFVVGWSNNMGPALAACNLTAYHAWRSDVFDGVTSATGQRIRVWLDEGFWGLTRSLFYEDYTPSFGIVQDKAAQVCRRAIMQLKTDTAGKHTDNSDYVIFQAMCSDECQDSDIMQLEATLVSGCTCLELSPQPDDDDYHTEGEICKRNSARQMCDIFDKCGTWNCDLADFMCPRHEYNKEEFRLRGLGDCSAAQALLLMTTAGLALPAAAAAFFLLL